MNLTAAEIQEIMQKAKELGLRYVKVNGVEMEFVVGREATSDPKEDATPAQSAPRKLYHGTCEECGSDKLFNRNNGRRECPYHCRSSSKSLRSIKHD